MSQVGHEAECPVARLSPLGGVADWLIDTSLAIQPQVGLHLASLVGRLGGVLGRRSALEAEVQRVFRVRGWDAGRLVRRIATRQAKSAALTRLLLRVGPHGIEGMLEWSGRERLEALGEGEGCLLVVAPWGPRVALAAGLRGLAPGGVLVLGNLPWIPPEWGLEVVGPGLGGSRGSAALKAAVDRLRSGGRVSVMFAGAQGGGEVSAPFCGGTLNLTRGIACMARLGRARVFPVTARWRRGARPIALTIHPEVELSSLEDRLAADRETMIRLATALEGELARAPEDAGPRVLSLVSTTPERQ